MSEAQSTISTATLEAALRELQGMPEHSIVTMNPSAPQGIIDDLKVRGYLVQLDPNAPLDVMTLRPPPDTGTTDPPPEVEDDQPQLDLREKKPVEKPAEDEPSEPSRASRRSRD